MKLKHLHFESCPSCGARVVSERSRGQHCNGQWFEEVEFACGCVVKYVPNFSRQEIKRVCPNTKESKLRQQKRDDAMRKLRAYVGRMDVDDEFKKHVMRYL